MNNEIFATVKLPVGGDASIFEGKGKHYFSALINCKGDTSLLVKFLIIELCLVGGKKITPEQLDDMHMRDVCYLSTVIGTMMSDEFVKGF